MKICLIVNPESRQRVEAVRGIRDILLKKKQQVYLSSSVSTMMADSPEGSLTVLDDESSCVDQADVVIAIGGDGTMLHTARLVGRSGKPVLGINSGKLGFLADTPLHDASRALDELIEGNWTTEKRFTLQAGWGGNSAYALNEFLFSKHSSVAMITLEVYCDGRKVNKYWADGLIIATPTGSTAYNLSSGGPVIYPGTDVMVITPVCPHALTTRPLVLPADRKIRINADPGQQILFSNDGKICDLKDDEITDIEISRSDFGINLIKMPDRNYFETLRSKLMWGMDLRE